MKSKRDIVLLDLFSGIGGFAKGFTDAGYIIKKHYFSEIDPHAIANYKYNFKNSEYVGAIESVQGRNLGRVDVITFGSPCQDFSVAGNRAGLDGERSSLIAQAIRLIIELRPRLFVWENVKGAFSSNNGADFWSIIQSFANIGGYHIEWQLCNTSWLLPQNRERIYLTGRASTPGRNIAQIFPLTEDDFLSKKKNVAKTGQSQTKLSGTLTTGKTRATDTFVVQKTIKQSNRINSVYFSKSQQDRVYNEKGLIGCLSKSRSSDKTKIFAQRTRNGKQEIEYQNESKTNTLTSVHKDNLLDQPGCIRRLTEIEFERLQGFPDNWTKYGDYDGAVKEIASTNKRLCEVAVVRWLRALAGYFVKPMLAVVLIYKQKLMRKAKEIASELCVVYGATP